jgi:hypothetical protein
VNAQRLTYDYEHIKSELVSFWHVFVEHVARGLVFVLRATLYASGGGPYVGRSCGRVVRAHRTAHVHTGAARLSVC